MNERIKELAEQSGARYGRITPVILDCNGIEKFAELIIRECARIASKNDYADRAHPGAAVAVDLMEYFRIEE